MLKFPAADGSQSQDDFFMQHALDEAELAKIEGEVPVGAVCVKEGKIIAWGHNQREKRHDPTAHAEILAIVSASKTLESWRLTGCTLYVTLEPCLMCAGALVNSRIERVAFGPFDPKAGAMGSLYNVANDPRLNHEIQISHGILEENSSKLLAEFFDGLRSR